jgi:uncharacterized protein (DUF427 family)
MPPGRVEPLPRRIRGFLDGVSVVDTVRAVYGWEWPRYPQYYIPLEDIRSDLLISESRFESGPFGLVEIHGLQAGEGVRPASVRILVEPDIERLRGHARFDWGSVDEWFEEDERVFVHPRNPYTRVDALRSTRSVTVELDGVVLARTDSPVTVFETGLPTRYYINRTEIDFEHLVRSETVTECPYKGTTSGYWSVRGKDRLHRDVAWSYDFPTRQLLPIAGLVAFYNEKVDLIVDGERLARPRTHFS